MGCVEGAGCGEMLVCDFCSSHVESLGLSDLHCDA